MKKAPQGAFTTIFIIIMVREKLTHDDKHVPFNKLFLTLARNFLLHIPPLFRRRECIFSCNLSCAERKKIYFSELSTSSL